VVDTGRSPAFIDKGDVLEIHLVFAQVVKLVDTLASGASALMGVEVQVLFWAPYLRTESFDSVFLCLDRTCKGFRPGNFFTEEGILDGS
jgi:hypothetical protein